MGDADGGTVDLGGWPVVVVRGGGRVDADAARSLVGALGAAVEQGRTEARRLGLVLDTGRLSRPANDVVSAWWAEHQDRLGEVIAAGASVVAAATVERNRELIAAHPELFPFPAWCAATEAECVEWVEERM